MSFQEALIEAAQQGKLLEYVTKNNIDKKRVDSRGRSLLHYACFGPNADAIISFVSDPVSPLDIDKMDESGTSPLRRSMYYVHLRNVEILSALGASLQVRDGNDYTPLDIITQLSFGLQASDPWVKAAYILISNGARLASCRNQEKISYTLKEFECGVLCCRNVIVTLLGLKKRRHILGKLDRFLVQQELAVEIWSTRTKDDWSEKLTHEQIWGREPLP